MKEITAVHNSWRCIPSCLSKLCKARRNFSPEEEGRQSAMNWPQLSFPAPHATKRERRETVSKVEPEKEGWEKGVLKSGFISQHARKIPGKLHDKFWDQLMDQTCLPPYRDAWWVRAVLYSHWIGGKSLSVYCSEYIFEVRYYHCPYLNLSLSQFSIQIKFKMFKIRELFCKLLVWVLHRCWLSPVAGNILK